MTLSLAFSRIDMATAFRHFRMRLRERRFQGLGKSVYIWSKADATILNFEQ